MDDVFATNDPRDFEIERRLEAFADLRLSPSLAATTRMRAAVMGAAHRRAAMIAADATAALLGSTGANRARVAGAGRSHGGSTRRGWRRPLAALLAAALTVGILAGTVVGSGAGGPLYATRIWVEAFNLPKDVLARAHAEVARLEARLQEAGQASAAGDASATAAALDAYSTILVEAAEGTGGDPAAMAAVENSVTRHVAVLTALMGTVPTQAQAAIQHALSSSTKVLQDIEHPSTGVPGSGGGGGGSGGAGSSGQPGGPVDPANGGPDKTPKPKQSPDDKAAQPERTPRNDQKDPKASPSHTVQSQRP